VITFGTNIVLARCDACRSVTRVTGTPGKVTHVALEHECDCPFLLAIEAGQATAAAWVGANGYPITYEAAS
jgi:hypothetical protein